MSDSWQGVDLDQAWLPFVPSETQPWDQARIRHLYRRAGFGATQADIELARGKSPQKLVDELVDLAVADNDEEQQFEFLSRSVLAGGNTEGLGPWWVYRLLFTQRPLRERLTLFWHGHFATSAEKVTDVDAMIRQNQLLRDNALGSFRSMTHGIAKDPAMLIYLDSVTNRKAHPNENFARELMELFCLGEGNYSEHDVQELSRCFTGWEIRRGNYRFNRYQHDTGEKTILGRTDRFEDAAAVDWILDQPQCSRFIATKLFRYLVCDEPAPTPELIEPLAKKLRDHELNLEPVVRMILSSQLFFSTAAVGQKIRSPVDFVFGLMRSLEATGNTDLIAKGLSQMGQALFFPPNVKGWDGGRTWINASSLLTRANFVARLLSDGKTRFRQTTMAEYLQDERLSGPEEVLNQLSERLLVTPLGESVRERLLAAAKKEKSLPDQSRELIRAITLMPQYQLG